MIKYGTVDLQKQGSSVLCSLAFIIRLITAAGESTEGLVSDPAVLDWLAVTLPVDL